MVYDPIRDVDVPTPSPSPAGSTTIASNSYFPSAPLSPTSVSPRTSPLASQRRSLNTSTRRNSLHHLYQRDGTERDDSGTGTAPGQRPTSSGSSYPLQYPSTFSDMGSSSSVPPPLPLSVAGERRYQRDESMMDFNRPQSMSTSVDERRYSRSSPEAVESRPTSANMRMRRNSGSLGMLLNSDKAGGGGGAEQKEFLSPRDTRSPAARDRSRERGDRSSQAQVEGYRSSQQLHSPNMAPPMSPSMYDPTDRPMPFGVGPDGLPAPPGYRPGSASSPNARMGTGLGIFARDPRISDKSPSFSATTLQEDRPRSSLRASSPQHYSHPHSQPHPHYQPQPHPHAQHPHQSPTGLSPGSLYPQPLLTHPHDSRDRGSFAFPGPPISGRHPNAHIGIAHDPSRPTSQSSSRGGSFSGGQGPPSHFQGRPISADSRDERRIRGGSAEYQHPQQVVLNSPVQTVRGFNPNNPHHPQDMGAQRQAGPMHGSRDPMVLAGHSPSAGAAAGGSARSSITGWQGTPPANNSRREIPDTLSWYGRERIGSENGPRPSISGYAPDSGTSTGPASLVGQGYHHSIHPPPISDGGSNPAASPSALERPLTAPGHERMSERRFSESSAHYASSPGAARILPLQPVDEYLEGSVTDGSSSRASPTVAARFLEGPGEGFTSTMPTTKMRSSTKSGTTSKMASTVASAQPKQKKKLTKKEVAATALAAASNAEVHSPSTTSATTDTAPPVVLLPSLNREEVLGPQPTPTKESSGSASSKSNLKEDSVAPVSRETSEKPVENTIDVMERKREEITAPSPLIKGRRKRSDDIPEGKDEDKPEAGMESAKKISGRNTKTKQAEPSVSEGPEFEMDFTMEPPREPSPPRKIPYKPTRRLTQPASVLQPIYSDELAFYRDPRNSRNPLRRGIQRDVPPLSVGKGKISSRRSSPASGRVRLSEDESRDNSSERFSTERDRQPVARLNKRGRDESEESANRMDGQSRRRIENDVASHYNARQNQGRDARQQSVIIGLKSFNNWVKSILIRRYVQRRPEYDPRRDRGPNGRVLDMGCGKGGDIAKWDRAKIADYVGVDIAAGSIADFEDRLRTNRKPVCYSAHLYALDCFSEPISTVVPKDLLDPLFDTVSMQFCIHYAFESANKVRMLLENVSRNLRTGGVYFGTTVSAHKIYQLLSMVPEDAKELKIQNDYFKIVFKEREHKGVFGHAYRFELADAIDDCEEFVVDWDNFVEMAREYRLRCIYRRDFEDLFAEEMQDRESATLAERMNVVRKNGELMMDDGQWTAANLYMAFAFEKMD